MGVDYTGNFGIGVKIIEIEFTEEMVEDGIDTMCEYMEDISSKTDIATTYFEIGEESYGGERNEWYMCLKKPFKDGVYNQQEANNLMKYLDEDKIDYEGKIDCIGGINVW